MKYGFIGCGNMGGALARAAAKTVPAGDIVVSDKDASKTAAFSAETGVSVGTTAQIAIECKYIFLGVKPQMLSELFSEIKPVLDTRKDSFVLVSMAAGVNIGRLRELMGAECPIIRIMPNLPASVGEGMILYCSENVTDEETNGFLDLMSRAGKLCPLDERLIDAGSALSGCGPAYAFMFIEALADGGVQCGLPRDKAMLLAAQTLLGSAKAIIESGTHPDVMKDAVCSPGGTTIAGVHALEKAAFRGAVADAVLAGYERTLELGK